MRAVRAARRSAERRPIPFLYVWEELVERHDPETGELLSEEYREKRYEFQCKGEVSTLLLSELAYNADLDVADPDAMSLIRNFFSQAFGVRYRTVVDDDGNPRLNEEGEEIEVPVEDDQFKAYRYFFTLHTRHGNDDVLMELLSGLVEDFMARPTKAPSPSQRGPELTGEVSKVVSLSRGTVEIVPGETLSQEDTAVSS